MPSCVHEFVRPNRPLSEEVQRIALDKALAVAERLRKRPGRKWILGADTLVVCKGRTLGKPRNRLEALRMLRRLNGTWHRVYTGVALVKVRASAFKHWTDCCVSRVKARRIPERELETLAGKNRDKAGGYAVQDEDDPFIEKVAGPFDNVVGLPLSTVRNLLKKVPDTFLGISKKGSKK